MIIRLGLDDGSGAIRRALVTVDAERSAVVRIRFRRGRKWVDGSIPALMGVGTGNWGRIGDALGSRGDS